MEASTSPESRADVERSICELLAGLVDLDTVNPDDDFFDMGGHSLLAAEAIGAVRKRYGVTVRLRDFLEDATAAHLCDMIMPQVS